MTSKPCAGGDGTSLRENIASYDGAGISRYDLVMWDGAIPERSLAKLSTNARPSLPWGKSGTKSITTPAISKRFDVSLRRFSIFPDRRHVWSARNLSAGPRDPPADRAPGAL